jgi:hypothetical protein
MRARFALIAALFLFFNLSCANPSFAARSLTITANKDSLFGDEEIILTASASGFTSGETIYLKGAYYQDGSTNYFGYTKNGDNWIKNGDSTLNQKTVQIDQWDKSIIAKSDFADSGYRGEGGYKLKIGFYYLTSGGNLSSINWSNSLDVNLNEPDPTPTNTPTPTLVPTSIPTNTPTPTRAPTPTLKPSSSPTPKEILPTDVLGESTQSGESVPNDNQPPDDNSLIASETKNTNSNLFQKIFIFIGVVFIVTCAILIFLKIRKGELTENE